MTKRYDLPDKDERIQQLLEANTEYVGRLRQAAADFKRANEEYALHLGGLEAMLRESRETVKQKHERVGIAEGQAGRAREAERKLRERFDEVIKDVRRFHTEGCPFGVGYYAVLVGNCCEGNDLALNATSWRLEALRWKARARRLEDGIRNHRDQRGDDRCWLDDRELYALLPGEPPADTTLPPEEEFIANCRRFWRCRQDGTTYDMNPHAQGDGDRGE